MTIAVKSVVDSAAIQLYDESNTNWSEPELVTWLREGLGALAEIRPDAFTRVTDVALAPGTKQDTPADVVRVISVLAVTPSGGSTPVGVTRFDMRSMTAARPSWRSDTAGAARQYAIVDDDTCFYVYPPQPNPAGTAQIEALVIPTVPDVNDGGYAAATVDLDERFRRCLVDYVLYRAFMKDSDEGGQATVARASSHYQAFVDGSGRSAVLPQQQAKNMMDGS